VRRWEARDDIDGVGFVFSPEDPYCGVDYDDCFLQDGRLHGVVAEDLDALEGYAEISPSGEGIKVIVRAEKPGERCKTGNVPWDGEIEIYDRVRFFTITGWVLDGHEDITDSQTEVEEVYERSFPPAHNEAAPPPRAPGSGTLEDDELLGKARSSKHGAGFARLFDEGNISGYKSHSEADFALLGRLGFWTRCDPEQMTRLFRRSALYRPGKGLDYVERSVASSVVRYEGKVYDPPAAKKAARQQVTAGMWAPLFTQEWEGMAGATDHNVFCGALIEASENGYPRRDGSINTTPGTEGLAKRCGTTQKTVMESLKRLQERGLIEVIPKTRARAREVIVIKPDTQVYSTNIHTAGGTLSAVDLCEFGELLRLRWGQDARAKAQRVGKVAGLFLHWLLAFRQGLTTDTLAECTGRRKDAVVRYLKRLEATGLVVRDGDTWRLPASFWERLAGELGENSATAERLQEQGDERRSEAEEYWSSDDAPDAGDVPPDSEEEWLRGAGWEPLRAYGGEKHWRHPVIEYLPLLTKEAALTLLEARDGRMPEHRGELW
jgi:predicted transcriptional regulator